MNANEMKQPCDKCNPAWDCYVGGHSCHKYPTPSKATETGTSIWSYSGVRATLSKNGKFFAIVSTDAKHALKMEDARELVETLASGSAAIHLQQQLTTALARVELLEETIQEIRSANHNEFGCVSDSGIEAIINGLGAAEKGKI